MIARAAALVLALSAPQARALDLALPVACILGETCYIQQGFDHDPGPGAQDFTCGSLTYDGHDGTDFALPTRAAMLAGTQVLAAAPGKVRGTRDGVPDAAPYPPGQDCGNGVVLDHGDGWETQYCHLRQGSVLVRSGEPVEIGTPLGLIGQSGNAEFPHLHLSLRRHGQEIDPFAPQFTRCGAAPSTDLWQDPAPTLAPGGLLQAGFADHVPEWAAIKAGLPPARLTPQSPALVLWLYLFGTRAGDALIIQITGPEGNFMTERIALEKTQALSFRALGRKRQAQTWPPGSYHAIAQLVRAGTEIDRIETAVTLP